MLYVLLIIENPYKFSSYLFNQYLMQNQYNTSTQQQYKMYAQKQGSRKHSIHDTSSRNGESPFIKHQMNSTGIMSNHNMGTY